MDRKSGWFYLLFLHLTALSKSLTFPPVVVQQLNAHRILVVPSTTLSIKGVFHLKAHD